MPDRYSTLHLTPVFPHPILTPTHSPFSSPQPSISSGPGNAFLTGPTFPVSTFNLRSLVAVLAFHSMVKPTQQTACCRRRRTGPREYRLLFSYSISFPFGLSGGRKRATNSLRRLATNRRFRT